MNGAAPSHRRLAAQTAMELRLLLRNGENLLVAFGIPAGLLVFFTLVDVLPTGDLEPVAFLLPGALVAAIMGSALVALAITTGFERSYLVLKRLGATPLRRSELVGAKILATLAIQVLQVTVLVAIALALGWARAAGGFTLPGALSALGGVALGTAAFGGIALAMAGRLRATATLALANATFVVLLLASGLLFPLAVLPGAGEVVARLLPSTALGEVLRAALDTSVSPPPDGWAVLALWALGAPGLAAAVFRWS